LGFLADFEKYLVAQNLEVGDYIVAVVGKEKLTYSKQGLSKIHSK
jgi:hypothetical protein